MRRLLISIQLAMITALTPIALVSCDDSAGPSSKVGTFESAASDGRGPKVLGLQIGLTSERAQAALASIDSLKFQRGGGTPSAMVAVRAIVALGNESLQLVESNGSLVVGGKVQFFAGWRDTVPCYLPASKAAEVRAMVDSAKASLVESRRIELSRQLDDAKRLLEDSTKLAAERQEQLERAWAQTKDAVLKLAESGFNGELAAVGADGSAEAAIQEFFAQLQLAKDKARESLEEAPDDASRISIVKALDNFEKSAKVRAGGGSPDLEWAVDAAREFPGLKSLWDEFERRANFARLAPSEGDRVREKWKQVRQLIDARFSNPRFPDDVGYLLDELHLERSQLQREISELTAAWKPASDARSAKSDAAARVDGVADSLSSLEVREQLVAVSDEQVLVDDSVRVIVTLASGKVSRIVFSEEFCNLNFGAKAMSDAEFLSQFCRAYGIPALAAQAEARVDEAVKNSSLRGQFDFEMKKALSGAEARSYEDRDAGYRFVMQGKLVMLEAIQKISDTSLGR